MTSLPSIVTVWPEFGPPHRTSHGESERLARRATTLPFPSDPYCPPRTIVAGMVGLKSFRLLIRSSSLDFRFSQSNAGISNLHFRLVERQTMCREFPPPPRAQRG